MQSIIFFGIYVLFAAQLCSKSLSAEVDLFDCGVNTGCISSPIKCNQRTCDLAVHWERKNDKMVTVHVMGKVNDGSYVAVGFSKDDIMGEDAVVACLTDGTVLTFINPGPSGSHRSAQRQEWKSGRPLSTSATVSDGRIICSFSLPAKIDAGEGIAFDLINDPVTLLLAKGPASNQAISHHTAKIVGSVPPSDAANPAASPVRPGSDTAPPETGRPASGPPASTSTTESGGGSSKAASLTSTLDPKFILFISSMFITLCGFSMNNM